MPRLFLEESMIELGVFGLGIWSPGFSNWQQFSTGLSKGDWLSGGSIQAVQAPIGELRRAPQSVKMAVEVMRQACEMASANPADVAVVFSSSMGDMQISDYLCHTLSKTPRLVSPTRFHNSVHNAPTGYWSIATQSYAPASAISAYSHTAPMAFLEAAIQAFEEDRQVLLVTQEGSAVPALRVSCPSNQPFSSAFLLAPLDASSSPKAIIRLSVARESVDWPELPRELQQDFLGNPGARLLPLLSVLALNESQEGRSTHNETGSNSEGWAHLEFPLSSNLCLKLSLISEPGPS